MLRARASLPGSTVCFSEAEVYGGLGIIRVSPSEFCNVELRAGKRRDAIKTTYPNITPTNNSEQQTHAEEDSSQ